MDKGQYQDFSKRLMETMKAKGYAASRSPKGICIQTLARFAGASEQICRRYVRGDALPDYEKIIKIANSLQVSPGWLLFGEQSEPTENSLPISEDLLYYIIQKSHALYQLDPHPEDSEDFPDFVIELIRDVKGVNTTTENLKKVIDIALSSICSYKEKQHKRMAK